MKKPLLSTCIITQNNAASLRRAIANTEHFSDEIVVVDGGSTDGTEFVARSHPKCVYLQRPFDGNFAAQKNFGFDHASGQWIFELDEDEVVCDDLAGRIRPLAQNATEVGFALRRWWLSSLSPLQYVSTELFETAWIPRLFRNDPRIRYVFPLDGPNSGVIHHEFDRRHQPLFVRLNPWRLLHFHYLLHDRADREARFAWFNQVDPHCAETNARCYLYENFKHRIQPCPARCQADSSFIAPATPQPLAV
ncbi:MAG: glycosyltransferase [Phycisphaerales bacterium]|nr:MAG: glycosyltransferase [Phycisphaerales bacterium]